MSEIEKLNMIAEWQEQHKQLIEDLDNSKKRIVDLEKENAEQKLKLEALEGQTPWKDIKDKSELIKENAELKTDYEVLSCSVGDFGELQDKLEEEQRKNNGLSDNFNRAKEIIKQFMNFYERASRECYSKDFQKTLAEAEQFLKELEK